MRHFFLIAAFAGLLLVVPSASADVQADESADRARALLVEGVELRAQGNDREALERFKLAYAVQSSAKALAQIALAEQALAMWTNAFKHLSAAIALNEPWVEKNRAALEGALGEISRHLGRLSVRGGPVGSRLWVDGNEVAELPLDEALVVNPGTHRVEVQAEGYNRFIASADVAEGETVVIQVILSSFEDAALPSFDAKATTSPSAPPPSAGPLKGSASSSAADQEASRSQRLWGWSLLGSGAALGVGTGAIYLARLLGPAARFAAEGCEETLANHDDCESWQRSASTLNKLGIVTGSLAGAAALAGGLILFTVPAGSAEASGEHALSCGLGPGELGMACVLAF